MKKIILLLMLLPFLGFSQECKFEKNEFDDFTKTKLILTKRKPLVDIFSPIQTVLFQLQYNGKILLFTKITVAGNFNLSNTYENDIKFLLNSDEIISYPINEQINSEKEYTSLGGMSNINLAFEISRKELEDMLNIGIKKIRIGSIEKYKDIEVKNKKRIESVSQIIRCFLLEIDSK